MVTFLVLCILLLIALIIAAIVVGIGGTIFLVLFGDIIICAIIIVWLVKKLVCKNKKEKKD